MDKQQRMKELIKEINKHSYNYYVLDNPTISDSEWDKLYNELLALENETGVVFSDSPSRKVGGEVLKGFKKVKHLNPLYSLDKCQSLSELEEFFNKVEKEAGKQEFSLEYKFDGLTIAIEYRNGEYFCASTRGNGSVGEDVTEQVRTIKCVPQTIPFKNRVVVQGEAIMPLSSLEKYNKTASEPLKNARNGVAGAIRNLDPKETAKRELTINFYAVPFVENKQFGSQVEVMNFLRENGLRVNKFYEIVKSFNEAKKIIEKVNVDKKKLDFLIDGMVFKINNINVQKELGYTIKFPKWAMAFKFEAEEVSTVLEDVVWQVGRTGKITPIACLTPVELAGATIRRATLNNTNDIARKNLSINSRVFIRRSNEVIPEVLGLAERLENAKEIVAPSVCPSCGTELVTIGANLFCPNSNHCKEQVLQRLTHFCTRDAMNIEGISDKTALSFYEKLNVRKVSDIYSIKEEDLLNLEKFKEKKAKNIINSIEKSKHTTFDKFIYSLGILNVGKKTSKDLAKKFCNYDNLKNATNEELISMHDIGEVVCESIIEFFEFEQNLQLVEDLFKAGLQVEQEESLNVDNILKNKKVVITGSFEKLDRTGAQDMIAKIGGQFVSAVSKNTDFVIYGENSGSKLEKAQQLGIKTISESELMEILKGCGIIL